MSRSRMFDNELPADEEQPEAPSPRKTIVGGRPPENPVALPPVPTGIQRLLRLAAADANFKVQLLERRDAVAEAAGVELTATERLVLRAASVAQLEAMALHLPPAPPARREFIRQSAAAAAAMLAAPVLLACESCSPSPIKGSQPDMPPPRPTDNEMQTTAGAAPDEPPPRPTSNPMQTEGGAAPDEPQPPPPPPYPAPGGARPDPPPERPETSSPTRGIRHDMPPEKPE